MIEGEGIHALQFPDRLLAPHRQRLQQHFRIAGTVKPRAVGLKFRPQLPEVVNFSVEDDAVAGSFVEHRLVAGRRKVEDRKPTKTECGDRSRVVAAERKFLIAFVIGPAMDHGPHHGPRRRLHLPTIAADDSANPAHEIGVPALLKRRRRRLTGSRQTLA